MLEAQGDFDATALPRGREVPTLLLYRKDTRRYSTDWGLALASQIPGAQLQLLPGEEMVYSAGDGEAVLRVLDEFFSDESGRFARAGSNVRGSIVTILFTDIEEHTALLQRIGDERGRAVLREHGAIVRAALRRHNGTEVKTRGDGFMASFVAAFHALECAIEMQRAFRSRNATSDSPILIRIGLNAGEPIAEHDDLFGSAVILVARTASKARGGEIYVTDVVRQLAAGRSFLFSDLGETELRGFEDPVRLFELSWQ
jgi:class 3 adenylate cyclase